MSTVFGPVEFNGTEYKITYSRIDITDDPKIDNRIWFFSIPHVDIYDYFMSIYDKYDVFPERDLIRYLRVTYTYPDISGDYEASLPRAVCRELVNKFRNEIKLFGLDKGDG